MPGPRTNWNGSSFGAFLAPNPFLPGRNQSGGHCGPQQIGWAPLVLAVVRGLADLSWLPRSPICLWYFSSSPDHSRCKGGGALAGRGSDSASPSPPQCPHVAQSSCTPTADHDSVTCATLEGFRQQEACCLVQPQVSRSSGSLHQVNVTIFPSNFGYFRSLPGIRQCVHQRRDRIRGYLGGALVGGPGLCSKGSFQQLDEGIGTIH